MAGDIAQHLDGGGLNPDDVEPLNDNDGNFPPMPVGYRGVEIKKAVVRANNNKNGVGLDIEADVIGPDHANRKVFKWINITNPSTACMGMGRRELGELSRACGIKFFDNEDELLGKQLDMKLIIEKNKKTDKLDNSVKGYAILGTGTPAAVPAGESATTPQQAPDETPKNDPATGKKMPWAK